jgi:hypothetical protein
MIFSGRGGRATAEFISAHRPADDRGHPLDDMLFLPAEVKYSVCHLIDDKRRALSLAEAQSTTRKLADA